LLQQAQAASLPVLPTYGMTEACSQLATLAPEQSAKVNFMSAQGLAGKPLSGVELSMIDAQWHTLPRGQVGRILARGEMISHARIADQSIPGRWQADGWFLTDDYGRLDADGMLYISHRHSDVIICGGENILSAEVEHALLHTGLLSDAAVVGLADAEWGQIVAALVVPHGPHTACSAASVQQLTNELEQHLRQRLDPVKIPRRWCVLAVLPRGETGKLKRQDCQRLLAVAASGQPAADLMEN
jgi:O-succinylbenzoic acid--CoA ligase